jgi:phenylalanyl-tRNA synthetase beta chain
LLPKEPRKLAIFLSGSRDLPHWEESDQNPMDFYDLKGIIEGLLEGLHIHDTQYKPYQHPTFHPGKCALVHYGEVEIGVFGEIHPLVKGNYDFPESPVLVADLNIEAIAALIPDRYYVSSVPVFPPVLEDLAFIVDENIQVQEIVEIMKAAGGTMIAEVNLFDVYRGGQAGSGKKSLAFSLKYQDSERTLTDKEVSRIRNKIINQLSEKIGAELRS